MEPVYCANDHIPSRIYFHSNGKITCPKCHDRQYFENVLMTNLLKYCKYKCRYCECELTYRNGYEHESYICPKKPKKCKHCNNIVKEDHHSYFCPMKVVNFEFEQLIQFETHRKSIWQEAKLRFLHSFKICKTNYCGLKRSHDCPLADAHIQQIFEDKINRAATLYKLKKYVGYEVEIVYDKFKCNIIVPLDSTVKEVRICAYLAMIFKFGYKNIGENFQFLTFNKDDTIFILENKMIPYLQTENIKTLIVHKFKDMQN